MSKLKRTNDFLALCVILLSIIIIYNGAINNNIFDISIWLFILFTQAFTIYLSSITPLSAQMPQLKVILWCKIILIMCAVSKIILYCFLGG